MMVSVVSTSRGLDLEELYREHYRDLVRLASILLDRTSDCEEVVQDAFVGLLRRGGAVRDPAKAPAYLRTAVLNGARSRLRRRRTSDRHLASVRAPDDAPGADEPSLLADSSGRVVAALRQLPDRQREVLMLRYHLDLSEAEIAATLGISTGSVKTHAHRGLARLADLLEEDR